MRFHGRPRHRRYRPQEADLPPRSASARNFALRLATSPGCSGPEKTPWAASGPCAVGAFPAFLASAAISAWARPFAARSVRRSAEAPVRWAIPSLAAPVAARAPAQWAARSSSALADQHAHEEAAAPDASKVSRSRAPLAEAARSSSSARSPFAPASAHAKGTVLLARESA